MIEMLRQIPHVECKHCGYKYVPRKADSQFCPKCSVCLICGIHHKPRGRDCSKVKRKKKE
ncbi:MAG: hypothetical protein QXW83_00105 [Nitrososphaerales archaeon]